MSATSKVAASRRTRTAAAALGTLTYSIWTPCWGHVVDIAPSHFVQYGIILFIILQTILVLALIVQLRRRTRHREEEHKQHAEITHSARLALIGEITASIAHEVTQPLSAILNNIETAQFLLKQPKPDLRVLTEILADVKQDDIRAHRIVQRLRGLLRKREMHFEYVDVNALTQSTLTLLESDAARRNIAVRSAFDHNLPSVPADPVHLEQVILNLLLNAMDAMSETPPPRRLIEVRTRRSDGEDFVQVEIADNGPGIAPEHVEDVFDSFFTTKNDGMGLGLSIVRSIISMHGGAISARNRTSGGAIFTFTLPIKRPPLENVNSSPSILIAPQVTRGLLARDEESKSDVRAH